MHCTLLPPPSQKYNGNRFGLTVVTGRHTEPPAAPLSPALLAKYPGLAPDARLPATGGRLGADMQVHSRMGERRGEEPACSVLY